MTRAPLRAALAAACLLLAAPAHADSLGLTWFEAGLGHVQDTGATARLSGDWRIGPAHGLQLDLGFADRPGGALGEIGAHLYLMPQDDRKYGFFATLADIDGEQATGFHAGVEAMFALSDRTVVEARAGIGRATGKRPGTALGDLDFIAAEARVTHALGDAFAVRAGLSLADFDERLFRAVGYRAEIGMAWLPQGAPLELSAALVREGLHGRDGRPGETRVELAATWRFGGPGGARRPVRDRAFTVGQPIDGLLRRGLF